MISKIVDDDDEHECSDKEEVQLLTVMIQNYGSRLPASVTPSCSSSDKINMVIGIMAMGHDMKNCEWVGILSQGGMALQLLIRGAIMMMK